MGEPDAEKRIQGIADAQRFIDLASQLNAPYIRVFGKSSDSAKPVTPDAELKKKVSDGLHELGEYAGTKNVTVLIESHDDFTKAAVLQGSPERSGLQARWTLVGCVPHLLHFERGAGSHVEGASSLDSPHASEDAVGEGRTASTFSRAGEHPAAQAGRAAPRRRI